MPEKTPVTAKKMLAAGRAVSRMELALWWMEPALWWAGARDLCFIRHFSITPLGLCHLWLHGPLVPPYKTRSEFGS